MREIIEGRPAVRALRDVGRRGAGAVRRPAVQVRDHRAGRRRPPVVDDGWTPARSTPAARSACTATPTSSSTCASARTCPRRAGSATSSCRRWPAPTGAATRRARCCSASTARRGSRSRPSTSTSTAWRRPRSATIASWPTELDLLSFPYELGGGLAVWHPKGAIVRKLMEDYSRLRHEQRRLRVRATRRTSPTAQLFETSAATSAGTPTACTRRWRWTTARTT